MSDRPYDFYLFCPIPVFHPTNVASMPKMLPISDEHNPLKVTPKKGASPGKRAKPPSSGEWIRAFLTTLGKTANVRYSCSKAGVSWQVAYRRKQTDPIFAANWESTLEDSIDDLEAIARSRAIASSDTLIIFLLKSHRRSVYGDKPEVEKTRRRPLDIMLLSEEQRNELLMAISRASQLIEERTNQHPGLEDGTC